MPSQAAPQQPSQTQAASFPTGKQSLGSETGLDEMVTRPRQHTHLDSQREEGHMWAVAKPDPKR
jgi:hypothetical protein